MFTTIPSRQNVKTHYCYISQVKNVFSTVRSGAEEGEVCSQRHMCAFVIPCMKTKALSFCSVVLKHKCSGIQSLFWWKNVNPTKIREMSSE